MKTRYTKELKIYCFSCRKFRRVINLVSSSGYAFGFCSACLDDLERTFIIQKDVRRLNPNVK